MSDDKRYIQDPKTGLFEGSRPGNGKKKVKPAFLRKKAAAKKAGNRRTVNHGIEFAIPGNFHGDIAKRSEEMFKLSREKLAQGGHTFPDKDVAKYQGDGYWTGQASEYGAGKDELTAKQEPYGKDHSAVAINRIFSYKTYPTVRNEFVVVGDMGKDDGKIETRRVNNTGMYASYIDENGVRQQYPHPTNIVDFHPDSLDKFCGKSKCGREPIMMKTCESPEECAKVQTDMKERIKKWREENVKNK
ncbi:hypothetical protein [Candidatus Magnetominusculus dajiuhuensis]|uniref:hypothetical protein n=1 Tax=Candidatus Magnetominusculus dajiuhuensis TaxID=3137712 RepID=UPI003B4319A6